jgi:lysophospholipase L1-like esterase
MGASFPPPISYTGPLAYKRNARMALTNLSAGGSVLANASNAADTVSNSFNSRSVQVVPANCGGMTDIVLRFPGFMQHSGAVPEANIPTAFTVTASLEYPIGTTPQPFYFKGLTSGTVNPGPFYLETDPLPMFLPAGASLADKTFAIWTPGSFVFSGGLSSTQPTVEWTNRGTGLADHTLDLTVFASTTAGLGYAPVVFGTPLIRVPVLGIMGDSIGVGAGDYADSVAWVPAWGRALKNKIGFLNQSIGGSTMVSWLARLNGTAQLYLDSITHLLFELGVNDISIGQTLAQLQANFITLTSPFLARGVKVYALTLMPHTTSTDGWITTTNQTLLGTEAIRQGYNTWLRANWRTLGLSGIFDDARAVDPTDSGKWGADVGASASGVASQQAALVATLTGGVISAINRNILQSGSTSGAGYPSTVTLPWVAVPYPGETGSGGAGTCTTNSSGNVITQIITTPGSGYSYPPMINITGPWTADGLHPTVRGYNQLFANNGFTPSAFTL